MHLNHEPGMPPNGVMETEKGLLKQKLKLKGQAVKGLRQDMQDLKDRLFLLNMRERLSERINNNPDRELSTRLDCVDFLIQSLGKLK